MAIEDIGAAPGLHGQAGGADGARAVGVDHGGLLAAALLGGGGGDHSSLLPPVHPQGAHQHHILQLPPLRQPALATAARERGGQRSQKQYSKSPFHA